MAQTLSLKGEPGSSSPCAASPGCCQGPGPKVRDWGAAARFLPPPQGRSSLPAEGQGVEGALEGLQDNIAQACTFQWGPRARPALHAAASRPGTIEIALPFGILGPVIQ